MSATETRAIPFQQNLKFVRCQKKYKFNDPEGICLTTLTVVHWIDLFTRKELKYTVVNSLKHCQEHKELFIHAWCLMPSHLHLIISSKDEKLSDILRDFKKYTSKEIIKQINLINESRKEWLLEMFKKAGESLNRIKNYKVWQDGNHPKQLTTNWFSQQKLDHVHNNAIEAEIVENAEHYIYSSAGDYTGLKGLLEIEFIG